MDLTKFSRTSAKDNLELVHTGFEAAQKQLRNYSYLRRQMWAGRFDRFLKQVIPDLRPVRKRLTLDR